MVLIDRISTAFTYVVSFLTFSLVNGPGRDDQAPLLTTPDAIDHESSGGPIFKPPGGRLEGVDSDFTCDYSAMPDFYNCSTPTNRRCWLKNRNTGFEYNINTNDEDTNLTPNGTTRTHYLNITDSWVNADGMNFTEAKIFNITYPGPWIQACWGDVCIHPMLLFHSHLMISF